MTYDLNYYDDKIASNRDKYFMKSGFVVDKLDTNKIFFEYILNSLLLFDSRKICKILDLGTGTGYVPRILVNLTKKNFHLVGVDLSKNMLDLAIKNNRDNRIHFLLADNKKLPFKDGEFDIVTNKLTTQFDIKEVIRVLKPKGIFVFKEYGQYKGFEEIYLLFKKRYKKLVKKPDGYVNDLKMAGFSEIILQNFSIKREYSLKEIDQIFKMANLIEKYSNKDLKKIKKHLLKNGEIKVNSDPFIIFAKK